MYVRGLYRHFHLLNCLDIMLASVFLRASLAALCSAPLCKDSVQRSKALLHPPAPRVKHSGFALQVGSGKSLRPTLPMLCYLRPFSLPYHPSLLIHSQPRSMIRWWPTHICVRSSICRVDLEGGREGAKRTRSGHEQGSLEPKYPGAATSREL